MIVLQIFYNVIYMLSSHKHIHKTDAINTTYLAEFMYQAREETKLHLHIVQFVYNIMLCLGSIGMYHVISESSNKGTIL